jgi:AcrR family transcriptional regulator
MTSKTGHPHDRKAAIMEAAAQLFAAHGFSATGIDDIGKRVGITGPAIYRYFKNKEALLNTVLFEAVTSYEVSDAAIAEGIQRVVGDMVAVALDRPAWLATYVHERQRLTGQTREALRRAERRTSLQWRKALLVANPALDNRHLATRQAAALSALSAIALRPATVARPQLDLLIADAMVAVLVDPRVSPSVATQTRAPVWQRPVSRREQIRAEAVALFRRRGFQSVNMDEIAGAVGISEPAIYSYFADPMDIFVDAFVLAAGRAAAGVQTALTGVASAADALDRLAIAYFMAAIDSVDLMVVTGREGRVLPPSAHLQLSRRLDEISDTWVGVLRDLRPELSDGEARTLVSGVFPLLNQLGQRRAQVAEAAGLACSFLLGPAAYLNTEGS